MRQPIDLHGLHRSVTYPSSIYSLESHENLPFERFAHNVFRTGIEALHSKNLPEQLIIQFPASSPQMPAWAINANIRLQTGSAGQAMGFLISFSELLPTMLLLFAHLFVGESLDGTEQPPSSEELSKIKGRIQQFLDVANVGIKAYRNSGIATAIRESYRAANLTFPEFQECIDDFDSITQFIANHEVAHAYVGQLHAPPGDFQERKAFEFVADLLGTLWLFTHFVLNTPDSDEYRKRRGLQTYGECIEFNVRRMIRTQQCLAILSAIAHAQVRGKVSLGGGLSHPSGMGRHRLQMLWLVRLTEGCFDSLLGSAKLEKLLDASINSSSFVVGTVATRKNIQEMQGEEEVASLKKASKLIMQLGLKELEDAAGLISHLYPS